MRVKPPPSLRINREAMLQDVRDRLRMPAANAGDATDPGSLLIESAAWMSEQLSMQLDRYPLGVMRQFIHMLGGDVLPARPSVGVVVLKPTQVGTLSTPAGQPSPVRMFTPQNEQRDLIEFSALETEIPLRPMRIISTSLYLASGLYLTGKGVEKDSLAQQMVNTGSMDTTETFGREIVEFLFLAPRPDELLKKLQNVIEAFDAKKIGWLSLSVSRQGADRVLLSARLSPERAFAQSAPLGYATGGDLVGNWGLLDESTWTPPVTLGDIPQLPASRHGSAPLPGPSEGTLLIPRIPPDTPIINLLRLPARPMPTPVVEALWRTLVHLDGALGLYRPTTLRSVLEAADDPLNQWVTAALRSDAWNQLVAQNPVSFAHIDWDKSQNSSTHIRLSVVTEPDQVPETILAFGLRNGLLVPKALPTQRIWHILLPTAAGNLQRVECVDITPTSDDDGVLLTVSGRFLSVWANPALIINAPAVFDNREIPVQRGIPEAISLLSEDVLSPQIISRMDDDPLPEAVRGLLARLPLSSVQILEGERVRDFRGMQLDPVSGTLMTHAPDPNGETLPLRIGQTLRLDWYRRTDGALGRVEAEAISFVEHPPTSRPALVAVTNPLGNTGGMDRESEEACIQRLFGPGSDTPILPTDWEQTIRTSLGPEARHWIVRCWGYAERTLISTNLWPPPEMEIDEETLQLSASLLQAGPDTLVVTVGRSDRCLNQAELVRVRLVVEALVRRAQQRLGNFHHAIVTPLWPLRLRSRSKVNLPVLPCFRLSSSGWLTDTEGRESPATTALMLNAAVVAVDDGSNQ